MKYAIKATPAEREFSIIGDFTAKDEDLFFDVFMQIRTMTEPQVVFNLAQCSFIDSAAMGMLVVACQESAKRNAVRVIRSPVPEIRELLGSAGFEKFFYFQ